MLRDHVKVSQMNDEKLMFSKFVRILDMIFSWSEPEMAGFLPVAPSDCLFGGITVLSSRTCIRGRANRVAVLLRKEENSPIPPAAPPKTQDDMILRRTARNKMSAREAGRHQYQNIRSLIHASTEPHSDVLISKQNNEKNSTNLGSLAFLVAVAFVIALALEAAHIRANW